MAGRVRADEKALLSAAERGDIGTLTTLLKKGVCSDVQVCVLVHMFACAYV